MFIIWFKNIKIRFKIFVLKEVCGYNIYYYEFNEML